MVARVDVSDNKPRGKEPRGSPRPVAPWSLGNFPGDQQVVALILTLLRLAGSNEANCRISISVAFLPQEHRTSEKGRKHSLKQRWGNL